MAYVAPITWSTGSDITAARLNQDLRDNPSFLATPPSCSVFNSANISIANGGSGTALTFDSERWDSQTLHSTSSNTGRITAPVAGKYLVGASIQWNNTNTTGVRQIQLRVGGTTVIAIQASTGASDHLEVSRLYTFTAAQYVEVVCFQNNGGGGALNVLASGNYSPEFWATWVSL